MTVSTGDRGQRDTQARVISLLVVIRDEICRKPPDRDICVLVFDFSF